MGIRVMMVVLATAIATASPQARALGIEFGQPTDYVIGADRYDFASAEAIEIGDVTGDGAAEIVVSTSSHISSPDTAYKVYVFRRQPDGTLATVHVHQYGEWSNFASLALADFNGDGIRDVVVGHAGGIDLLVANATGGFEASDATTDHDCYSVAATDANLDERMDVACLEWAGDMTVLLGDGEGGFPSRSSFETSAGGYNDMKVGDVTGDGFEDLVITSVQATHWYVHPHDGIGAFVAQPMAFVRPGDFSGPSAAAIGDFNGDGRKDVVVATSANHPDAKITFYYQGADGALGAPVDTPSFDSPQALVAKDMDGNGEVDLLVGHGAWNVFGRHMQVDGVLSAEVLSDLTMQGFAYSMTAGDVDGDGCMDAAGVEAAFGFSVALGRCHLRAEDDLDGDGRSDVFWRQWTTGRNVAWRGAVYADQIPMARAHPGWMMSGIADIDGDGRGDVFWRHGTSGANRVWSGGDSNVVLPVRDVPGVAWTVAGAGDLDEDGREDIVWRNVETGANAVWLAGDAGNRRPMANVRNTEWTVAGVGDFDGNGADDLLWRNPVTGANTIWRTGDAGDQDNITDIRNTDWEVVGVGDFDASGRDDILWRNRANGRNVIWRGGQYADQAPVRSVTDPQWKVAAVGDYDGDGRSDILWRHAVKGRNVIWSAAQATAPRAVRDVTNTEWSIEQ